MTAPETITYNPGYKVTYEDNDPSRGYIYRRADLPPTLAAALALPEIAAMGEAANAVLHDVRDLIANSEGVSGLHMNGDVADWESLLAGGAFEAWLRSVEPFATALAALTPPATQETP